MAEIMVKKMLENRTLDKRETQTLKGIGKLRIAVFYTYVP